MTRLNKGKVIYSTEEHMDIKELSIYGQIIIVN